MDLTVRGVSPLICAIGSEKILLSVLTNWKVVFCGGAGSMWLAGLSGAKNLI